MEQCRFATHVSHDTTHEIRRTLRSSSREHSFTVIDISREFLNSIFRSRRLVTSDVESSTTSSYLETLVINRNLGAWAHPGNHDVHCYSSLEKRNIASALRSLRETTMLNTRSALFVLLVLARSCFGQYIDRRRRANPIAIIIGCVLGEFSGVWIGRP